MLFRFTDAYHWGIRSYNKQDNAMAVSQGYLDFVTGQLDEAGTITSRRMFGGVGLYADLYFFALLSNDRLYFKVDESNRGDFEEQGMEPFRPYDDGRSMSYYEVPVSVLEDVEELTRWAQKAIRVAKQAPTKKRRS